MKMYLVLPPSVELRHSRPQEIFSDFQKILEIFKESFKKCIQINSIKSQTSLSSHALQKSVHLITSFLPDDFLLPLPNSFSCSLDNYGQPLFSSTDRKKSFKISLKFLIHQLGPGHMDSAIQGR